MCDFDDFVKNLSRKIKIKKECLLFLCIGSNDIIWDSIGPLIGTNLQKKIDSKYVLGDIKNNIINNKDLIDNYSKIKGKYIIAIDSAISEEEIAGQIFVSNKPLIMGLGVNSIKGVVGNLSIKIAMCNSDKITRKYVDNLAKFIASGITQAIR